MTLTADPLHPREDQLTDTARDREVRLPVQADPCPRGGVHDPRDSDRPCPRCGASPR